MLVGSQMLVNAESGPLLHDVAKQHILRLCAPARDGAPATELRPAVEGRIRHLTEFVVDTAEEVERVTVGAFGSGHDTYAQALEMEDEAEFKDVRKTLPRIPD